MYTLLIIVASKSHVFSPVKSYYDDERIYTNQQNLVTRYCISSIYSIDMQT